MQVFCLGLLFGLFRPRGRRRLVLILASVCWLLSGPGFPV